MADFDGDGQHGRFGFSQRNVVYQSFVGLCRIFAPQSFTACNSGLATDSSRLPITTATGKPTSPSGANPKGIFIFCNVRTILCASKISACRATVLTVGDYDGDGKADLSFIAKARRAISFFAEV